MSYMGSHNRTRRLRGQASEHTCFCGDPAQEWAYMGSLNEQTDKHGRVYSENPEDYQAMCVWCHRRYDKASIRSCPKGHAYEGENVIIDAGKRKCRECVYERNRRAGRARRQASDPEWRERKNAYQREYRARRKQAAA